MAAAMTEPLPDRAYWTIEQASAFVGVPKKSVYKWPAQYPTMPVLAMGTGKRKTWLFPIDRFQKWLRDQEQGRGRPLRRQVLAPSSSAPNGASSDARRPVC